MQSDPHTQGQATPRVSDTELLLGAVLIGLIVLVTSTLVPIIG